MNKEVPKSLLDQIKKIAPPTADIVTLTFQYGDEDYNIGVFVDEEAEVKLLQDQLLDLAFAYDDAHGTTTLCYVWPKSQRRYIVAA